MIQAHRIRRNDTSRWPRRFLWLDTETRAEVQPSGRKEMRWRCGVTIYDGWNETRKEPKPPITKEHQMPRDLWRYVYDIHVPRSRTVFVAHNLGFDLRSSAAFVLLPEWHWKLTKVGIHGQNITVTWRLEDGATLVCVDSHSWLPHSFAKIAHMMGEEKIEDPAEDDDDGWMTRCHGDVILLREAMKDIWDRLQTDDAGTFQRTGAGMAWSNWRHRHYTHEVVVHDCFEARDAELAATYTGRAEAWKHGHFTEGPYDEHDLALAYARCAGSNPLPVKLHSHVTGPNPWPLDSIGPARRALVRAEVETEFPVLPVNTSDGIMWPVGKFVGWWWDVELELARLWQAKITPTEMWFYHAQPALSAWSAWIIDAIENPATNYTEVQRAAFKHWSRALIGKFGSRYDNWRPLGTNPSGDVCLMPTVDTEDGSLANILLLGDSSLVSTVRELGEDACPAIQGVVMAHCRYRLWKVMTMAGLENVHYVDTDSVITNRAGSRRIRRNMQAHHPWALRIKRSYDDLTIYGPRQLVAGGERRFAGISRRATDAGNGTLRGEIWESAEQAFKRGNMTSIVTIPAVWTPHPNDKRREHVAGGRTEARRVGVES